MPNFRFKLRLTAGYLGVAFMFYTPMFGVWQLADYLQYRHNNHLSSLLPIVWLAVFFLGAVLVGLYRQVPIIEQHRAWEQRILTVSVLAWLCFLTTIGVAMIAGLSFLGFHYRTSTYLAQQPHWHWSTWWFDLGGWALVAGTFLTYRYLELVYHEPERPFLEKLNDLSNPYKMPHHRIVKLSRALIGELTRRRDQGLPAVIEHEEIIALLNGFEEATRLE